MKIVTHDSSYHADDVFAVASLLLVYPDAEVVRSREQAVIDSADIVVDTGGIDDMTRLRFDHHQPGGAGERENGIPYASFGLVWRAYGEQLTTDAEVARMIDERLCMPIDAMDNGVEVSKPVFEGVREYGIRDLFYSYTSASATEEDIDHAFRVVVDIASGVLKREIALAREDVQDWRDALAAYEASADKRIILLPRTMSYKKALVPTEALYVVYPRPDGKWSARALPSALNSFEVKRPFPAAWAGLRDEALQAVTGISDASFCHRALFIATARTKEGAVQLAQRALTS